MRAGLSFGNNKTVAICTRCWWRNIDDYDLLIKIKESLVRADIGINDLQKYKIIFAYVLLSTREV